MNKCHSAGT